MKSFKDFVVLVDKADINDENILQVPFTRKGLVYLLYLSTNRMDKVFKMLIARPSQY